MLYPHISVKLGYSVSIESSVGFKETVVDNYIGYDYVTETNMLSADMGLTYISRQYISSKIISFNSFSDEEIAVDDLIGDVGITTAVERIIGLFGEYILWLDFSSLLDDGYVVGDDLAEGRIVSSILEPIEVYRVYLSNGLEYEVDLSDNYLIVDNIEGLVGVSNAISKSVFLAENVGVGINTIETLTDNYLSQDEFSYVRLLSSDLEKTSVYRYYLSSRISVNGVLSDGYLTTDNYIESVIKGVETAREITLFGEYVLKILSNNELIENSLTTDDYNIGLILNSNLMGYKTHQAYLSSLVTKEIDLVDDYLAVDNISESVMLKADKIIVGEFVSDSISSSLVAGVLLSEGYLATNSVAELKVVNIGLGVDYVLYDDLSTNIRALENIVENYLSVDNYIENIGLGVGHTFKITRKTNITSSIGLTSNATEGYIAYNNLSEVKRVNSVISADLIPAVVIISPVVTVVTKNICQEITLKITNNNNFIVQVYKDDVLLGTINANSNTNYTFSHALNGSGAGGGGTYTTTIKFVNQSKSKSTNFTTTISNICKWR